MAERRKVKKKKDESNSDDQDKPSKQEYSVAKYLKKNVPCKKTKFLQHAVEYFTASKAVDSLLGSPWANPKHQDDVVFTCRDTVVEFLDLMLRHKFFHRAKKLAVTVDDLGPKALKKYKEEEKKRKEERKRQDDRKYDSKKLEDKKSDEEKKDDEDVKKKEKRRVKLEMHIDQAFVDGSDAYVWIYDPIPMKYWFSGALLVIGVIAVCLFPLWPMFLRKNIYYLSILAAGFLIFILALIALRLVIFFLLWVATLGQHHLWILPNLTEDVGFLASFWPLYKYEYFGPNSDKVRKKKSKKAKDSDQEDSDDEKKQKLIDLDNELSCSDSESSQNTQTDKDFEIIEKKDIPKE